MRRLHIPDAAMDSLVLSSGLEQISKNKTGVRISGWDLGGQEAWAQHSPRGEKLPDNAQKKLHQLFKHFAQKLGYITCEVQKLKKPHTVHFIFDTRHAAQKFIDTFIPNQEDPILMHKGSTTKRTSQQLAHGRLKEIFASSVQDKGRGLTMMSNLQRKSRVVLTNNESNTFVRVLVSGWGPPDSHPETKSKQQNGLERTVTNIFSDISSLKFVSCRYEKTSVDSLWLIFEDITSGRRFVHAILEVSTPRESTLIIYTTITFTNDRRTMTAFLMVYTVASVKKWHQNHAHSLQIWAKRVMESLVYEVPTSASKQ